MVVNLAGIMAYLISSVVLIGLVTILYVVSFWASATNRSIEKLSAYEYLCSY